MFSDKRKYDFTEYGTKKNDENYDKPEIHTIKRVDSSPFDV